MYGSHVKSLQVSPPQVVPNQTSSTAVQKIGSGIRSKFEREVPGRGLFGYNAEIAPLYDDSHRVGTLFATACGLVVAIERFAVDIVLARLSLSHNTIYYIVKNHALCRRDAMYLYHAIACIHDGFASNVSTRSCLKNIKSTQKILVTPLPSNHNKNGMMMHSDMKHHQNYQWTTIYKIGIRS
jgi:hypothetical protein